MFWFDDTFYYSNLCHVCKSSGEDIKRCSICKAFAYCSKEHQIRDWKLHKDLCKVIAQVDQKLGTKHIEYFEEYRNFKVTRSVCWQNILNRALKTFENQAWMFPRVCTVCYSNDVLHDCHKCLNVSYCSEEHKALYQEQHSKYCNALKLCMEIDIYCYFHGMNFSLDISVCNLQDDLNIMPCNLEKLMHIYDNSPLTTPDEKIQFIKKSDLVAPAATILYGLQKSNLLINRLFPEATLTVHIVGADSTEMRCWLWKIITELPFHWIKNITRLRYCVIGPELDHKGITYKFSKQLCERCKTKNPKTQISFHPQLYHDVVNKLEKPDVVVAFNSGLHEFHNTEMDTWKNSLSCLTTYPDVPLILTAYTMKEIRKDVDILMENSNTNLKMVLTPQRNPFSNMKPIRDWETENIPVFYVNGYIAILSRTT